MNFLQSSWNLYAKSFKILGENTNYLLKKKKKCSGCAEIDILNSRHVIQQTRERSISKEDCKYLKKNMTFKTSNV